MWACFARQVLVAVGIEGPTQPRIWLDFVAIIAISTGASVAHSSALPRDESGKLFDHKPFGLVVNMPGLSWGRPTTSKLEVHHWGPRGRAASADEASIVLQESQPGPLATFAEAIATVSSRTAMAARYGGAEGL